MHRYRELRLLLTPDGYQAIWRVKELQGEGGDKPEDYIEIAAGVFKNSSGQTANFLPIAIAYSGRTDVALCALMPLLGVAFANLAHWQQSTNLRFYRELCAFPQRVVKGQLLQEQGPNQTLVPGKLRSGPMVAVQIAADADLKWDELEGKSMDQLEKGIAEKLSQIGQMGMAFLVPQTRVAETAEAKRIDSVAQNATLATAGQANEDALNLALEHHAWYYGIPKDKAPTIALNKDFDKLTMDAATILAYVKLVEAGMSKLIALKMLQAGGRIPADADLEQLAVDWEDALMAKDAAAADALALANKTRLGAPQPVPVAA